MGGPDVRLTTLEAGCQAHASELGSRRRRGCLDVVITGGSTCLLREGTVLADEADVANEYHERDLELCLRRQQTKMFEAPFQTECLFCSKTLIQTEGSGIKPRWCDADCRDGWEKQTRAEKARIAQG